MVFFYFQTIHIVHVHIGCSRFEEPEMTGEESPIKVSITNAMCKTEKGSCK